MSPTPRGFSDFVAEATEILEELAQSLMDLEEKAYDEPDPELLNALFRGAHSLKGLCALYGQEQMASLAHLSEELLEQLRLGRVTLDEDTARTLLDAVDLLAVLLAEALEERPLPQTADRVSRLRASLEAMAGTSTKAAPLPGEELGVPEDVRAVLTEYEAHRLRESARKRLGLYSVRAVFPNATFDQGLASLNTSLKALGEVVSTLPSREPAAAGEIAFDLLVASRRTLDELANAVGAESVHVSELRPSPEVGDSSPDRRLEPDISLRSVTQTVRVDIRRLDALMNAVGELLLIRGNIHRLADAARGGGHDHDRPLGRALWRESRLLERKLDELQKGILEVRMVPLGQVFDKLARLVRRLVRERGKEIDFQVQGGHVELDKLIVEELSDPLMHLIRNAIDHGIELPATRAANGKPPGGRIHLEARQQGNQVIVEVRDDGAGIDEERVRQLAIKNGLLTATQAKEMTRAEILNLVFLPGFSTARTVSQLSGRGVGLDVVKTNISSLSGVIELRSERGQGTAFSITLPVTLAIIRALIVKVSGRPYAVPLNSVVEIAPLDDRGIQTVFAHRGQTLPLMRLARWFGFSEQPMERRFVVIIGLAQRRIGVVVDELFGQQDIVIKPLGGRLQHVRGIAGATDLGNRRTVLVLDAGSLIDEVVSHG